ncbi:MAG: type II toxin-antitoxin system VapC family toxin [Spirochaetia bacterium]|nr:type II toxin-antitoxin system VapC family toxin [Spirochaetia bacterium]MBO7516569.1 type II toxin-antitoxin system VapC family toxin [Spirochaetia bacterium]
MIYVLDTCAAFEIAFHGPKYSLFMNAVAGAEKVIAPTLFDSEVTNVLWKYARNGAVDEENARKTLAYLLQMVDEYTDTSELAIEALHEGIRLGHSIYDMFYLVLARHNGATLLTTDKKFKALAKSLGVSVL